jgi:nicotinamidase-related amidase
MSDCALLIMDVQNSIVERFADGAPPLLAALGRAATAARANGIPVVYVQVAFRAGAPEINRNNRIFAALADSPTFAVDGAATQIHPSMAPQPGDIVVDKKRVSAFAGSDLDMIMRAQGVRTLVLTGIATSGVVLSTLRQAADLDYGLTVLRDGCADADEEVHRVLLDKVFPRQADVLTVDEWIVGSAAGS